MLCRGCYNGINDTKSAATVSEWTNASEPLVSTYIGIKRQYGSIQDVNKRLFCACIFVLLKKKTTGPNIVHASRFTSPVFRVDRLLYISADEVETVR